MEGSNQDVYQLNTLRTNLDAEELYLPDFLN